MFRCAFAYERRLAGGDDSRMRFMGRKSFQMLDRDCAPRQRGGHQCHMVGERIWERQGARLP